MFTNLNFGWESVPVSLLFLCGSRGASSSLWCGWWTRVFFLVLVIGTSLICVYPCYFFRTWKVGLFSFVFLSSEIAEKFRNPQVDFGIEVFATLFTKTLLERISFLPFLLIGINRKDSTSFLFLGVFLVCCCVFFRLSFSTQNNNWVPLKPLQSLPFISWSLVLFWILACQFWWCCESSVPFFFLCKFLISDL